MKKAAMALKEHNNKISGLKYVLVIKEILVFGSTNINNKYELKQNSGVESKPLLHICG